MDKKVMEACAKLNKEYGEGSVMTFNKESNVKMERIGSGSIGLDIALGGGWPKGRIIEIYGPESSGKCLDENSYILTMNGYKKVSEIFAEAELELFTSNKTVPIEYELINRYGEIEKTTHFTFNNKKPLIYIKTNSGFEQRRTFKHPLLTLSKSGNLVWKWSGEIVEGDFLVSRRDFCFGNRSCEPDTAYAIGLLLADGCFNDGRPSISNNDTDVINFIENKIVAALGIDSISFTGLSLCKDGSESKSYRLLYKKGRKNFYDKFDLNVGVAKDKLIPKWIRELNMEGMSSFIRGFMDVESFMDDYLETSSESYEMLYQLKLMLSQYNIVSFLDKCVDVKNYEENDYWKLCIYGEDYRKYIKLIGTDSSKQKRKQHKFISVGRIVQTNHDSIPNINKLIKDLYHMQDLRKLDLCCAIEDLRYDSIRCTHTRLKNILSLSENNYIKKHLESLLDYYFDEVVEVSTLPEVRTFDFAMSKTNSFIADGCINHNTTLALHAIAESQKNGGMAAFIDAEHAFDPIYAENLGITIDDDSKFLFSQPMSGDEAIEIARALIATGKVDIIVIDSVAAMIPKAELQGDVGDSKMGLHARLMSQAMRMLTGEINKTKTTVIFINQLREKIGVMFGNPETTPGGNALKFYASVRCDIRRISQNKEADVIVSNRVRVKVIKNKTAPPFCNCEFNIVFGEGIDSFSELIDKAVEFEIIKKSGSWFSYGETKLGQGLNSCKEILKDNPELVDEIIAKLTSKI